MVQLPVLAIWLLVFVLILALVLVLMLVGFFVGLGLPFGAAVAASLGVWGLVLMWTRKRGDLKLEPGRVYRWWITRRYIKGGRVLDLRRVSL